MKNTKSQKKGFTLKNVVILVILLFLNFLLEDKYFYNIHCTVPPECSNVRNVSNVVCPEWIIKNLQKNIYSQNVVILVILRFLKNLLEKKYLCIM